MYPTKYGHKETRPQTAKPTPGFNKVLRCIYILRDTFVLFNLQMSLFLNPWARRTTIFVVMSSPFIFYFGGILMNEFVYRLGESKADKLRHDFTQVHNEDAYKMIKEVGPEGFSLYFVLSSIAMGKSTVMVTMNSSELREILGISESTLVRWKRKLEAANVIRSVPCYLPPLGEDKAKKGSQTDNVILLNASYPEIPEGWTDFAPNGFILLDGKPVIWEEYAKLFLFNEVGRKKLKRSKYVKTGTNRGVKTDIPRGVKTDRPGVSEMTDQGVSEMTPVKSQENRTVTGDSASSDYYKNKENIHKNNNKKTGTDDRYSNFYNLFPDLKGHSGSMKN